MICFPGLIARKLGMTQLFTKDGKLCGVTVLEAGPCVVTQVKTKERDGYDAIQLGFGQTKRLNQPEKGHLKGLPSLKWLREFRLVEPVEIKRGDTLDVTLFHPGDRVNVTGISKGRGFAGVVKRHGFAGGPKTHGQSDRHRAPGSIGSTTFPGKVYKGKRMAGHMGCQRVTVKNLEVIRVDPERHLIMVKGGVPGARNGLVLVHSARRHAGSGEE